MIGDKLVIKAANLKTITTIMRKNLDDYDHLAFTAETMVSFLI